MTRPTLFEHLAPRLGAQPEKLAAEVLAYLLAGSAAVREAVSEVCAIAAPELAGSGARVRFDGAPGRPDTDVTTLVGQDEDGATRIAVDCRFWSALGKGQPVQLLRQLSTGRPGALLVLAPTLRFTSLWAELRRRCRLAELPVHGDHAAGDPVRWTRVGEHQTMILASWRPLLAGAQTRALAAGDQQTAFEIDHLVALCARQDAGTFAPLTPDELAGASARRLMQLYWLVDDVARACEAQGLGTVEAATEQSAPGQYGRSLRLGMTRLTLCLSVDRWATLRETPFWLLVYDLDGAPARGTEARLERLASDIPPRLLRDVETDCPLVPLFPPVGVEREAVVSELARRVDEVARLLGEGPTAGFGSRA
jgi:hypothetical protein